MAWWNPFSWGQKKKEQQGPAPQFLKTYSYADYPIGVKARTSVEEKLAGLRGIPESVLEKTAGPIAQPYRTGFSNYTVPAISAAASARGLGRSTVPVAQIAQKGQETEETIADKLAQLRVENENLKRTELSEAEKMGYTMGTAEAGAGTATNAANLAEFNRQQKIRDENVDTANADLAKLQGLVLSGVGVATGNPVLALGGASSIFGSDAGGKYSQSDVDLIDEILRSKSGESATAKKIAGRSRLTPFQKYYSMFQ